MVLGALHENGLMLEHASQDLRGSEHMPCFMEKGFITFIEHYNNRQNMPFYCATVFDCFLMSSIVICPSDFPQLGSP